jgi:hypothetical protein
MRGTRVADWSDMHPIRRERAALAVAGLALGGCIEPAPPVDGTAYDEFTTSAWPALAGCASCHATLPSRDFLAGDSVDAAYLTVFEFQPPVIDLGAPEASLLLTMGEHTGPALATMQEDAVLAWLEAERAERIGVPVDPVHVAPFVPLLGVNALDLSETGAPGAWLRFIAEPLGAGLYLSELELIAGATAVSMAHPLFASHPFDGDGDPVPDPSDRFADVDLVVDAGDRAPIGAGAAAFLDFSPSDLLGISFATLEAAP